MWGYHLFNIFIHMANTALMFFVCKAGFATGKIGELLKPDGGFAAFFAAAVWGLHPLQTQAVTYITQRLESMMALCFFAAFYFALQGWRSERFQRIWHALAVFAVFLGIGAKEVIVAAPLVILVYDALFVHGNLKKALGASRVLYSGLASCLLILILWTATGRTAGQAYGALDDFGPVRYLLTQPYALSHYLVNTVWPHELVLDHGSYRFNSFDYQPDATWDYLGRCLMVLLLLAAMAWQLWRRRYLGFAVFWFVAILAPTSSVLPLLAPIQEHRVYLPLAGLAAAFAPGAYYGMTRILLRRFPGLQLAGRNIYLFCMVAILLCLGAATYQRNSDYASGLRIWQDTVEKKPNNPRAHSNLSEYLAKNGDVTQAIVHARTALALRPDYVTARLNLAAAYEKNGDLERAVETLSAALAVDDQNDRVHYHLANLYVKTGLRRKAEDHFRKALAINPMDPGMLNNYAHLMAELGNYDIAEKTYEKAISAFPEFYMAYNNLGLLYLDRKKIDQAVFMFQKAVAIKPNYASAHHNMGYALFLKKEYRKAALLLEAAVTLNPDFAVSYFLLANCHMAAGNMEKAITTLDRLKKLDPALARQLEKSYPFRQRGRP